MRPAATAGFLPDIITKLSSAKTVAGVEGGAGSSLAGDQKRSLHVRGIGTRREDGLGEIRIELFKPIGSFFRFLFDEASPGATQRAPSSKAYLAAGVAFCFMTQLGRYAQIVRRPLNDYRIVQDMRFDGEGIDPIRTQVFIETPEDSDYGRTLVRMGAQTCFLHAACQKALATNVSISIR